MGLLDEDSKFLLSIRSFVLPFGFDQGVPSNRLSFIRALRQRQSIMDLVQVYADFQRRDIGVKNLLACKARVSQSLSALRYIIDIYRLSIIEIYWVSSKIEEIFGVVETAAKIEELVKEQEILREDEQVRKMQEDFTIQQQNLIEESKLKSSLDLKKREAE
ncbi:hypothetical protein Cgig2_010663 [Carnegiea gigantea]|uniref:Uncharacterized protein n=1 Tax=Carnegiea gigantea TaxID=171969 RepID=A0A9Q1GZ04_9CARY|nr:hypothetical protein Cgig2_010663 [Carnegiea gigantea]